MSTEGHGSPPLRRRLFGYAPAKVDRLLADLRAEHQSMQAEIDRLTAAPAVSPEVSEHLAALLQSFAETVAEGQREADARAAQIVAEAEERAAQLEANALKLLDQANEMVANTYAEAASRYQEATAARQNASERIGEAVARLADALAILGETPDAVPFESPAPAGPRRNLHAVGGPAATASEPRPDTDGDTDGETSGPPHLDGPATGWRADDEAGPGDVPGSRPGPAGQQGAGPPGGEPPAGTTTLSMVRPYPAA